MNTQNPSSLKRCDHCGRLLPRQNFGRNVARSDGLQTTCRECRHRIYLLQTGRTRHAMRHFSDDELLEEIVRRGIAGPSVRQLCPTAPALEP